MEKVVERVRNHPDAAQYLADASGSRIHTLSASELAGLTSSTDIVAGFRTPERSVDTNWVAERFIPAMDAEASIQQFMKTRITAVRPAKDGIDSKWEIETSEGIFGPFDYVINSLWQGRLAIDRTAGLEPTGVWSHRYRQSLFLRTKEPVHTPLRGHCHRPLRRHQKLQWAGFLSLLVFRWLARDSSDISPPEPHLTAQNLENLQTPFSTISNPCYRG